MTRDVLAGRYRAYIACLNRKDWDGLAQFVHPQVCHNGHSLGLAGYRAMLIDDFRRIPDLYFEIALLVCDPPRIAARLDFDCTPVGRLFEVPVNGRRVRFAEHVFYEYREGKILDVLSVIDKAAISGQVANHAG